MNFSYSRLNTYKTCPYKFKRVYQDGEKETNYHFDLGSISHKMCELFLKEELKEGKLNEKLFDLCDESQFETEKLFTEAKSIITYDTLELLQKIFGAFKKKPRNYKTEGWLKKEDFLDTISYIGRYDVLVDESPEKIVIVDFKTSKKWKGRYNPDWMQLFMYAYLLYTNLKDTPKKLEVVLWFLRSNEIMVKNVKEIDMVNALEDQKKTAKDVINSISSNTFPRRKNNFCKVCKFREECY
jgi:CRISPR/Cas system-associated exonuclease Cas4 (RecB family)